MQITLSDERRAEFLNSLRSLFEDEFDEPLSEFRGRCRARTVPEGPRTLGLQPGGPGTCAPICRSNSTIWTERSMPTSEPRGRIEWVWRKLSPAAVRRGRVSYHPAVRRIADRHGDPSGAEDRSAAGDAQIGRRGYHLDRQSQQHPGRDDRLAAATRHFGRRRADHRCRCAWPISRRDHRTATGPVARQWRRPVCPRSRSTLRQAARRHGGNNVRAQCGWSRCATLCPSRCW